MHKASTTVASVDKDDVLPRTTAHWHNESVAVPEDLPASSNKTQRNIDIRYTLAVSRTHDRTLRYVAVCQSVNTHYLHKDIMSLL